MNCLVTEVAFQWLLCILKTTINYCMETANLTGGSFLLKDPSLAWSPQSNEMRPEVPDESLY